MGIVTLYYRSNNKIKIIVLNIPSRVLFSTHILITRKLFAITQHLHSICLFIITYITNTTKGNRLKEPNYCVFAFFRYRFYFFKCKYKTLHNYN